MSPQHNTESHSGISRFLIVTASFVVVAAGLQAAQAIIVPFLLSLTMALIFAPMVGWLLKRRVPHSLAICLVVSLIVVAGLLIGAIVGTSINSFLKDLPEYQQRLQGIVDDAILQLGAWGIDASSSQLKESFNPASLLKFAGNALSSLGNLMTDAFLILLTVLFILGEALVFSNKMHFALGKSNKAIAAFERIADSINHYMALKAAISLLTGGLITIWLMILGVDYAILWGVIAFLLNFIPNFGSILAAIPAVLLALIQLGPGSALLTAAGYVAANIFIGSVLEPRIMGKGLNLSSLVVFLSLVFWGYLLGPVGMLLSVPLTMMVKIAVESFDDTRWIAILLGAGNDLTDEARP
jgi:predicted PurR-regulated permease PerM